MSRSIEQLDEMEKWELVQEILDKKNGDSDMDWSEIVSTFDLDCNPETLRKAGVGVKLASDAGMKLGVDKSESADRNFMERQKLADIQRGIRKDMREMSRTELLCEQIGEAIKSLPEIKLEKFYTGGPKRSGTKRELVVGMGDFHFGADFTVTGLRGEQLNWYNSYVFEKRMAMMITEILNIAENSH